MHLLKHPVITRFSLLCLLGTVVLGLGMGYAISALLTRAVSEWEWQNTAALVRREVQREGVQRIFSASADRASQERWGRALSATITTLPEVVRVKVWSRERAAPALLRGAIGRGAEDALHSFALDLTPDQRRGVLPFPLGDGPCEQRGNGVTHPETEHDRAEQTEQREPRDDRVLEQVHPGATGATRVPRSSTYRWCRETARSQTARPEIGIA